MKDQLAESKEELPSRLAPDRMEQGDFFVCNFTDASLKGDTASMEHPLFVLRPGDTRTRIYGGRGAEVKIFPSALGAATIHDKDLWIYCISQLMAAQNRGEPIDRIIRFKMYDFLKATNRVIGGASYRRAGEMLARLSGTRIETNIETAGFKERAGFGLIDSWRVIEKDNDDRMVAVEVELPRWLFRSIMAKSVVTLSRDYFRLRKPLDRRLYELARKHCGRQESWKISLKRLYEKSGSKGGMRNFRRLIKELVEANELPDYDLSFDAEKELLICAPRPGSATWSKPVQKHKKPRSAPHDTKRAQKKTKKDEDEAGKPPRRQQESAAEERKDPAPNPHAQTPWYAPRALFSGLFQRKSHEA